MKVMNIICDKCVSEGLKFCATNITSPAQYIEGSSSADIWIVGLNPKSKIGTIEERSQQEFENWRPSSENDPKSKDSYFFNFKKVSPKLYSNWQSSQSRVSHTDLVKCFSSTFPPENADAEIIIENCQSYLLQQLQQYQPKIVICNGSPVCRIIKSWFPPITQDLGNVDITTSYQATMTLNNGQTHSFWIVLSGFIGRIDDMNKRRLGKEIEEICKQENIVL